MRSFFDMSFGQLGDMFASMGQRPFRLNQLLNWVYARGADSFEVMTDMPGGLRKELGQALDLHPLKVRQTLRTADGTCKFLSELQDGELIESVLIPEEGHNTLCLSSQAGCSMGCGFCETARMGVRRNLTRGEMLGQVSLAVRTLRERLLLRNLVFMGMGEPLQNLDELIPALYVILHSRGFDFSPRRVTVSTCGIVPGIERLAREGMGVSLAVSLNAADDVTRSRLMPVNRRYPLTELMAALRRYPLRRRQRITFEYVMIAEVNDGVEDALRLADLVRGIPSKINLIPCNPNASVYHAPAEERISVFQETLKSKGQFASLRRSRGADIGAACGQLRAAVQGNR